MCENAVHELAILPQLAPPSLVPAAISCMLAWWILQVTRSFAQGGFSIAAQQLSDHTHAIYMPGKVLMLLGKTAPSHAEAFQCPAS